MSVKVEYCENDRPIEGVTMDSLGMNEAISARLDTSFGSSKYIDIKLENHTHSFFPSDWREFVIKVEEMIQRGGCK